MSTEKLIIHYPELPRGEELARRTIDHARNALFKTYPILATEPYLGRIPTVDSVQFIPLGEIIERERQERPEEGNLIYQALKLCGIPSSDLDDKYFRSVRSLFYRSSHEPPELFVLEEFIEAMNHPDTRQRINEAYTFGRSFMSMCLGYVPSDRDLPLHPWKEILRVTLEDNVFHTFEEKYPNATKIGQAKDMLSSLLDTDIHVVASGTKVSMMLPNQTPVTAEFYTGMEFNLGISSSLSRKARPILWESLAESTGLIRNRSEADDRESSAESICRALDMPLSPREFVGGSLKKANVAEQPLINYYLESLIPLYYIQSDVRSKLDPWKYPS